MSKNRKTSTFHLVEGDKLKIKEILSDYEREENFEYKNDNTTSFNIVPQLLDYLHNQISYVYHLVEMYRHSKEAHENSHDIALDYLEKIEPVTDDKPKSINTYSPSSNLPKKLQSHRQNQTPSSKGTLSLKESEFDRFQANGNCSMGKESTKYRNRTEQQVQKINFNRKSQNPLKSKNDVSAIQTPSPPDIQDENVFPSLGSPTVVEIKKRVKPNPTTKYASNPAFSFQSPLNIDNATNQQNNIAFTSAPIKEQGSVAPGYKEEREQLKAFQKQCSSEQNNVVPELVISKAENISPQKLFVDESDSPNPCKVTYSDKLDFLAKVYGSCINSNCVPNLATEFYFICQLLTLKVPQLSTEDAESTKITRLFFSKHNCVYFAVTVLELCPVLLYLLKTTGLRLLLDMIHVSLFSPRLAELLQKIITERTKTNSSMNLQCGESVEESSYQEEIDSRDNFTSGKLFSAYRKQRDLFKKLYRDWESHHHQQDWLYSSNFRNDVHNLSVENSFHLSGLFVRELEAHCMLEGFDEDMEELLSQFEGAKLQKLQKRMKSSLNRVEDPNTSIIFQDSEGFFRDFLTFNNSVSFHQHLLDKFYNKLLEFNDFKYDITSSEVPDSVEKEKFFQRVKALRLYAKFLGFLYFLPYSTEEMPPINMALELKKTRSLQKPLVNLHDFIDESVTNRSLILVIPWVVEYLCNMDKLAPTLPYFENILQRLSYIYRELVPLINNQTSGLLLKLCLGRLFESSVVLKKIFFNDHLDNSIHDHIRNREGRRCLDDSFLIDDKLLRLCCPNIEASENLIKNYFSGKAKVPRKIKPYSVDDKIPSFGFSTEINYSQRQLEANFFHINPPSLKEVVDFSSERAVAQAKELFQSSFLPNIKESVLIKVNYKNMIGPKNLAQKEISIAIVNMQSEIWLATPDYVKTLCDSLCYKLISISISNSLSDTVVKMASQIASRSATNRVLQFIVTFTASENLRIEIKDAIKSRCKVLYLSEGSEVAISNNVNHAQETDYAIIKILEDLRSFTFSLLSNENCTINLDQLCCSIENAKISDDYLTKSLKFMIADWYMMILIYKPDLIDTKLNCLLFDFFCQFDTKPSNLINLICPRNLDLLKRSPKKILSWKKMESTVINLLNHGWLSRKELEGQCLSVLKLKWPDDHLARFASFLSSVVEHEKRSSATGDCEFLDIIEWLSWFCQET